MKIIVFFLIIASQIYSQKYEKDISYKEKRILEYKKEGVFPEDWKLFFKNKESDYIVFYDIDGTEIHFKYRKDYLDRESEKKTVGLFVGQAYRIKGKLIGIILYYNENEKKSYLPPIFVNIQEASEDNKKSPKNKLVYQFISFESTALDEVIK
jgi:hypothetical protein